MAPSWQKIANGFMLAIFANLVPQIWQKAAYNLNDKLGRKPQTWQKAMNSKIPLTSIEVLSLLVCNLRNTLQRIPLSETMQVHTAILLAAGSNDSFEEIRFDNNENSYENGLGELILSYLLG